MHYQIRTVLGVIWHKLNERDSMITQYPRVELLVNIYLFKVINRNNRKRCEICLKLMIKTPEQRLFFSTSNESFLFKLSKKLLRV